MHTYAPLQTEPSNDYHHLPVSDKQLRFARQIAARSSLELPDDVIQDRRAMSAWIDTHLDRHKRAAKHAPAFSCYPSSKQVAFAERIARIKRRDVPRECFRDKGMMSAWINSNRL